MDKIFFCFFLILAFTRGSQLESANTNEIDRDIRLALTLFR